VSRHRIHDLSAQTITFASADGDQIEGFLARPKDADDVPGVVLIHHLPGYDESTKLMALKFAMRGYAALLPNLYSREAPDAAPDDAAAIARAQGGVPDDRLVADVDGAARQLRETAGSNGKVGVIGHCSGGRQAFLSACRLALDAAVDCYGAFVVGMPPPESGLSARPVVELAPSLSCPLLGLFGADDKFPSPAQVAELADALRAAGKDFEFHSFDGAGHAFFAVDRPSYRVEAANQGWEFVFDFFGRHLRGSDA
jgi:carboxymethylenebutenolidase